jgi:hypothetical protein
MPPHDTIRVDVTEADDGKPRSPIRLEPAREAVASPTDIRPADVDRGAEPPWYLPGPRETAKLFGWRWIFFLPAVGLLVLLFWIPLRPGLIQLLVAWWKLWFIAVAVPVGIAINSAKHIIRARREPFCIHCGYGLVGLPEEYTCPECGRPYSRRVIDEYRQDPHWFIQRYRMAMKMPKADTPFEAKVSCAPKRKRSRDGT